MTKKKYKRLLFFALLTLAVLFIVHLVLFPPGYRNSPYQFSVILYQYTDNDWRSLMGGLNQAEKDENVVINFVTMPLDGTAEQEIELIEREVENGTEGILLAPIDSTELEDAVRKASQRVPVVTLETGIGPEDARISADNYELGYRLGSEMAKDMLQTGEKQVCAILEYTQRQSVQRRYEGFTAAIKEQVPDAEIEEYHREEGDFVLPVCIANMYANGRRGSYLAAFDKYCTEALIEASSQTVLVNGSKNLFRQRAYGIGNTEQTVHGLDTGRLKGLVFQNEFNIGYHGIQTLLLDVNAQTAPDADIEIYYATRETLYEPENQRLLFPLR